jgi:RNA recognition motif-containing protein
MELVTLPQMELERVALNKQEGKPANFVGDAKLYVGNLAFECTEQVIYEEFSKVGTVGEISMVYDNESGRPRGFAFVTMRTQDDANKVIQAMNGFEIMGRELSIREANN